MLKLLGVKTLTKPDKVTARQLIERELNFHHLYKNKMLLLKALLVSLVSKWDLQETLHNQMTKSWQNQRIFYRTDIVYKMPGKVDELTIWDDEGKHNLHKYYLTMYLKEAHTLYLESGENEDDKWSLSAFCNLHWKNVLLLGDSLKEQCKCQVHENFFLKLEATGCSYGSSWLENVLWDIYPNNPCWNNRCKDCKDGKRLIPKKGFNPLTCYEQWEYIESPSHLKNEGNDTYKKNCHCNDRKVWEVLGKFQELLTKVKEHQGVKRIQATEFQNDLKE